MKVNDSHNSTAQQCCKPDVHLLRTHGGPGVTFAQEQFYFLFDAQSESLEKFAMFY